MNTEALDREYLKSLTVLYVFWPEQISLQSLPRRNFTPVSSSGSIC